MTNIAVLGRNMRLGVSRPASFVRPSVYVAPSRPSRRCTIRAFQQGAACDTLGHRNAQEIREKSEAVLQDASNDKMFCYQCEQTLHGSGCTEVGVCGKTPEVSGLQDLLIYSVKGLGCLSHHARQHGIEDQRVNTYINGAIFSTLTNVNFDDMRFHEFVSECQHLGNMLRHRLKAEGKPMPDVPKVAWFEPMPHPLEWILQGFDPQASVGDLIDTSTQTGLNLRRPVLGPTLLGLQELIIYGLKGMCAYAHHAEALGHTDPRVYAFVAEALAFLSSPAAGDVPAVLDMCFKVGECNLLVLKMLSDAHADMYGHPTPTPVSLKPIPGKAIVITGHDMHDMEALLKQTEGTGINVYTHGEMLPAHGYPGLKKYKHLVGHFGGAWYRQKIDFANFPGSILVTTNCVMDPLQSYRDNIFTTNETGLSGVPHTGPNVGHGAKDFSRVIARAQQLPGFTPESCQRHPDKTVTVGFGHHAILGVADQVIDAIKTKKLEHIFVVGGCDGSEPQRKYYSKLYAYMPPSTMVLTMGCGKFRIFDQDFGMLPGTSLPRLLDMGQCNDSYSALVIAQELAKVFNTDINSLPLSLDLSWFEQKAVAVLLTLLHLGVRNIRLGPRLPAFLTPEAIQVLVDRFNLIPADVANPADDLKMMMACK